MRSIVGTFLVGMAWTGLLLELLILQDEQKRGASPESWWFHPAAFLAIVVMFVVGARLLHASFLGRLVRGRGFRPAPEDE